MQSDDSYWNDPDYGYFEVAVQGLKCGTGGNTCTHMAKIRMANTFMKLVRGADLEIGSISVTGPYHDDGNRITKIGNSVMIFNDALGITIVYDESKYSFLFKLCRVSLNGWVLLHFMSCSMTFCFSFEFLVKSNPIQLNSKGSGPS